MLQYINWSGGKQLLLTKRLGSTAVFFSVKYQVKFWLISMVEYFPMDFIVTYS